MSTKYEVRGQNFLQDYKGRTKCCIRKILQGWGGAIAAGLRKLDFLAFTLHVVVVHLWHPIWFPKPCKESFLSAEPGVTPEHHQVCLKTKIQSKSNKKL